MTRLKNSNPRRLKEDKSSKDNKEKSNGNSCDTPDSSSDKIESTNHTKAIGIRPFLPRIISPEKLSIKAPISKTSNSSILIDLTRKKEEESKNNNNSTHLSKIICNKPLKDENPNNNFLSEWKGSGRFGVSTKPKNASKYEDGDPAGRSYNLKQADIYVWDWVRKNLTLHPGSRLSASEVLMAYESDQEKRSFFDSSNVDLKATCHKVGMLVRRLYPDIQRCKITVNGKRVWVYKNLALRKVVEDGLLDNTTSKESLADSLTPDYYKSLWSSKTNLSNRERERVSSRQNTIRPLELDQPPFE